MWGLCQERLLLRGTVFHPDPMGKIISFSLLSLFVSVILVVCLRWVTCPRVSRHVSRVTCHVYRMFCTSCTWRKCCVCQCSVSIQCCCEPKPPRLRVIPATGDADTAVRAALSPAPPPAYLDIYPESFTAVHLTLDSGSGGQAGAAQLLSPDTRLHAADVR